MDSINSLITVVQVWSIICIIGSFIYMVYVTNFKNDQWRYSTGIISIIFSSIKYLFTKNDTNKRKLIVLGIFIFSILIQYFILQQLH
jgi:uncharacterized membrane protein HdeD (DUF308 family)